VDRQAIDMVVIAKQSASGLGGYAAVAADLSALVAALQSPHHGGCRQRA